MAKKTLDTTAQIVIEYDDSVMDEDAALKLVENFLQMPTKFPTREETLQAKALTIDKLEIYDAVEC